MKSKTDLFQFKFPISTKSCKLLFLLQPLVLLLFHVNNSVNLSSLFSSIITISLFVRETNCRRNYYELEQRYDFWYNDEFRVI